MSIASPSSCQHTPIIQRDCCNWPWSSRVLEGNTPFQLILNIPFHTTTSFDMPLFTALHTHSLSLTHTHPPTPPFPSYPLTPTLPFPPATAWTEPSISFVAAYIAAKWPSSRHLSPLRPTQKWICFSRKTDRSCRRCCGTCRCRTCSVRFLSLSHCGHNIHIRRD